MKNIVMILLSVVSIIVMTGCASVFSKSQYDVKVDTNAKEKLDCKVLDVSRQVTLDIDKDNMVYELKSYKKMVGLEHFPNKFVVYVKGNDEYPDVMKVFSACDNIWGNLYMGATNSGNLALMFGVKPLLVADETTGCIYDLPKEVTVDMELMKQAKDIAVREWLNDGKEDSAIMINSVETGEFAFFIPKASGGVKKFKKVKASKNADLLDIKTKRAQIPFEIFNANGKLILSGMSPARVSAVTVVEKFFILFHIKGSGFLMRAVPANPKNAGNLSFDIDLDPKTLRESFAKFTKNPKEFYVMKAEKNKAEKKK